MRAMTRWCAVIVVALVAPSVTPAAEGVKLRSAPSFYKDTTGAGLKEPEGVACREAGKIVVADTGNGRLVEYAVEATGATPRRELVLPELPFPIRVQISSQGEIFVLDGKLRRIGRVGADGAFKGYVDLSGGTAQGPVVPRGFKLGPKDELYVLDVAGARVLVWTAAGKLQQEIRLPAEGRFFSDLALGAQGSLLLLDSVGRRVFSVKSGAAVATALTETLRQDVDFPTALTTDDAGRIFIADQNGGGVVILGPDGTFRGRQSSMGWKEGLLRYPSDLCVDPKGNLFVADRGNNRIQGFVVAQ